MMQGSELAKWCKKSGAMAQCLMNLYVMIVPEGAPHATYVTAHTEVESG